MSAQAHAQPLLWFDLDDQTRFVSQLKRTLILSFILHLVILLVAAGLRLPQRGERPLSSVEVSLVSMPAPIKQAEVQKQVVMAKPPQPVPVSPMKREAPITPPAPAAVPKPVATPVPMPVLPSAPVRESMAKDILRDLQLPPDAPKFGDLTPAKSLAQPQPQAVKTKIPDLPRIPDAIPDRTVKPARRTSLSEELNRELEEELKNVKQFQPAAKLEIPKEAPVKSAPQQEVSVPVVTTPQTTLKTPGSSGTNSYWARVEAIIKSHWEPPPIDVSGSTYRVVVKFRFFRNGTVKDIGIQQASGNGYFDDAGRRAVQKPRAFPPFPAEMTEAYQDVEMVFQVGEAIG